VSRHYRKRRTRNEIERDLAIAGAIYLAGPVLEFVLTWAFNCSYKFWTNVVCLLIVAGGAYGRVEGWW
jgi:hypothetical protein